MAEQKYIINWETKYFIDTTPTESEPTWARLAAGITNVEPNGNEKIEDSEYYDGEGMAATEVTGGQLVYTVTGDRKMGDAAQDYVVGLAYVYGNARKSNIKVEHADGRVITGACTIANIQDAGGDANAKGSFGCELRLNGKPEVTDAPAG